MSTSIRNSLPGAVVALVSIAVLSGAMLLVRSHLSVATTALVLVVPVVLGCAMGGFPAGIVAVVGGFFAYDFFFIPPYYTLSVGAAQNWVALLVYVIVMVTVARMVSFLSQARGEARGAAQRSEVAVLELRRSRIAAISARRSSDSTSTKTSMTRSARP